MPPFQTTSGDLNADRRYAYAQALFDDGDFAAAADLMADTLTLVPAWVAGWMQLGEMAEAAGQPERAAEAYGRVMALDPADHMGAGLKLDLMRAVPVAERMTVAFVETLFDQYAPKFEASLVGALGYRAPQIIAANLPARMGRVLDLGCGTGLMGAAIAGRSVWLEGYDISAEMLRVAEGKAVYDALVKCDINQLALEGARWDTIIAADVMIYLGRLERIVGWVVGSLVPGGTFHFTLEAYDGEGFALLPSRRYAHSQAYVSDLLAAAGFTSISTTTAVLRQDRGMDIQGLVVSAAAPMPARESRGEASELA